MVCYIMWGREGACRHGQMCGGRGVVGQGKGCVRG